MDNSNRQAKIMDNNNYSSSTFRQKYMPIATWQTAMSDQSLKLKYIFKEAATSSISYPNISFIQMARHRISSLDGQDIGDFDELIHKKSTES